MTSPEPSPLPADPVRYRRKGLSVWFWIVIVFGLACIALGMVIGFWGPRIWPAPKAAAEAPAQILPWGVSTAEPEPVAVAAAPQAELAGPAAASGDVAGLSARVRDLEAAQQRTMAAASAALASASLIQAAQTSRPFSTELSAVQALLPPSADLAQLQRLAERGAPTRSALAADFPAAASHAIAAARAPEDGASLFQRARHALSAIVTVRRVDATGGAGAHAVLARAEAKLAEGDVEGALADLDTLPPQARDALGDWRARAERRAEIDRRLSGVRQASLLALREAQGRAP
jgi:hypothetical protein